MSLNSHHITFGEPSVLLHGRAAEGRRQPQPFRPAQPGQPRLRRALAGTTALTAAAVCGCLLAGTARALPTDGTVVEGQAEIIYGDNSVTIQQGSDRVIIEWQSFDIAANESVDFFQPSEFAAALNRVLSGGPSQILGSLSANGQVFISNPAGVAFGPDAHIDVASIVATSLDIMNRDFMESRLDFNIAGDPTAVVENRGSIRASGLAALVGPGARNADGGVIVADVTVIGGGQGFALDYYGDGLVNFAITAPTTERPIDADGNPLDALASNEGMILSDGGQVILTADAAAGVVDNVINLSGTVMARSIGTSNGQVVLLGGDEGAVTVAGTIDASGDDEGETGGSVHALGDTVVLADGAIIDVSGQAGGGTVLIGGDLGGGTHVSTAELAYLAPAAGGRSGTAIVDVDAYETGGFMPNADIVYFEEGADVRAGSPAGEGGMVVVWGSEEVQFHGAINTLGGAGGFVEVSTHGAGAIDGSVQTGYMLVDPGDVCVSTASTAGCSAGAVDLDDAVIEGVLNTGGTFELNTDLTGTTGTGRVEFGGGGNVTITNNTGTMGTFIIHAADTIDTIQVGFLTNGTTGTNYEWYAGSSQTASPVSSAIIDHFGQVFNTGGGHVIFDAADDIRIGDPLQTSGGDVTLIARGGDGGGRVIFRTADGRIDSAGGTITIQTDTLQINASATFDPLIDAGTGTVILRPFTAGRAINLGTLDAAALSIIESDIDRIAASVLRIGSVDAGNITISAALSPAQATSLSLVSGGNIIDGNALGADVTATGLALQAATSDDLETEISNLAFDITGGSLTVSNTGALTIAGVDDVAISSASGAVTLTASSPMTFNASVVAGGSISATAGESGAVDTDHLTVNGFVIVQSTGGDVTLQAGDDVVFGTAATVVANGVLTITAGFNDTDGDGGLSIGPSVLLVGNPINLTALNDIALVPFFASGSTVNVTSTTGVVSLTGSGAYTFGALSVSGTSINLGATISTTGAQTYNNPVVLSADTVLSSTGDDDITFNSTINGLFGLTVNTGGITAFNDTIGGTAGGDRLGSLTTDAGGTSVFNINGTTQVSIQNEAFFGDDVSISGNSQIWEFFGNTTFDGTVGGNVQMLTRAHNPLTLNGAVDFLAFQVVSGGLVTINGGSVTTTGNAFPLDIQNDLILGADTVFSSMGPIIFRGTVDGAHALTLNSPRRTVFRDVVGGTTRLTSITTDAPGTTELEGGSINLSGNTLTINDVTILGADTVITDAGAVTFNNTIDGAFALTIDAGGNVTFGGAVGGTDPLTSLTVGTDAAINVNASIVTADGNVTFDADVMAIAASINAGTGIVALRPRTAGMEISLGAEVGGSLSLTDAELDLITADILRVGSASAGTIDFSGLISLAAANVSTLSLITGDEITNTNIGTDVQVANLALQAVNGIGNDSQIDMDVDTVAALNTTEGGIALIESYNGGDLIVGTVDGVVGIRNTASAGFSPILAIQLETNNGDLIVNNDIFTSRRNIFLVAQYQNGRDGVRTFINNANIINADSGTSATNGKIDIRAGNMTLSAGSTITAVNRVILEDDPDSNAYTVAIELGGVDGVATLGLTDAELDTVTTDGVLQIGNSTSGNITISDAIAPAGASTLDLETGGSLTASTATVPHITVESLVMRTGTGGGPIQTDVDNLAFSNAGGVVFLVNQGDLTITEVDGLATSTNAGTTAFIQAQGMLTFAVDTSSTGTANYIADTSIDVGNGVVVSSNDLLDFDAPTVNLDGDLIGANGISGSATTVNVLGDTGGAEVQDAVFVAQAGALAGDNVTINIAAGTYASFVVPFSHPNLTIIGAGNDAGSITTIETGSPAITIAANGTTIQDMALTSGGGLDIGILVDGATSPFLTGINIVNVDFTNLTFGVLTVGNIGDGNAATVDVTIRGNSTADRAIFEDLTQAAIAVGDVDDDAVYVIQDLIMQDGSDADDLSAGIDGIALGSIGAATIQGVNMTHNAGFDGIFIGPTLNNATILIGGPDADDANTIRGLSDGIDTATISGGTFTVQGNDLIFGDDDAIDVNGSIISGAVFSVIDNTEILGNEDGLDFGAILGGVVTVSGNQSIMASTSDAIEFEGAIGLSSTVSVINNVNLIGFEEGIDVFDLTSGTFTVANNTLIQGQTQNGIEFEGFIFGTAQVSVHDNTDILGAQFGIEFVEEILGDTTVSIDRNGTATQGGAAYDGTAEVDLSTFVPVGRIQGGIAFSDISGNAAVTVSRNIITDGGGNGITFGSIASSQTAAVHNNFILGNGGNGIQFGGDIAGRTEVFQNFIAANGGNGIEVGQAASISPDTLFVQVNFLPGSPFADGNGGFGYRQIGSGVADLEGNWWGTAGVSFVASIDGVATADLPSLLVTDTGNDDANISPPFANTAFEFFAFQPGTIGAPLVGGPGDAGFATDVESLLDEIRSPKSQLDRPGGAQFFTNELGAPYQTAVFADSYAIGGLEAPGGLQPAAGGQTAQCEEGDEDCDRPQPRGPINLGTLTPAAGPGSPQALAEDTCVAAFLGDFWSAGVACQ